MIANTTARAARHLVGPRQHRQIVQGQTHPKRQAQPDHAQRQPLQPNVGADPPTQPREQGGQTRIELLGAVVIGRWSVVGDR